MYVIPWGLEEKSLKNKTHGAGFDISYNGKKKEMHAMHGGLTKGKFSKIV